MKGTTTALSLIGGNVTKSPNPGWLVSIPENLFQPLKQTVHTVNAAVAPINVNAALTLHIPEAKTWVKVAVMAVALGFGTLGVGVGIAVVCTAVVKLVKWLKS